MLATILLFCAIVFDESPVLLRQIELDQQGFSCNTIDGVPGLKTTRAIQFDLERRQATFKAQKPFRVETVTQADLDALVTIPEKPADKAKLPRMGYETIKEMFAERGHMSQRGLERLNPGVDWEHIAAGMKLVIPDFPSIEEYLSETRKHTPAEYIKVSLSRFEITAYDANDRCIALFPCSIARDKSKRPAEGELKVVTKIPNPNYTYTPDFVPKGQKASKYVLMDGPNNPVGVAWIGLNLPTYGIHGTPKPETVGSAESHGCFRLSNWNVARLYAMVRPGTKVIVEP